MRTLCKLDTDPRSTQSNVTKMLLVFPIITNQLKISFYTVWGNPLPVKKTRALTGVGAGLLEWGVMSPSEAVYVCLLVFNQSGDGLASFSGAYRTRKSFGWPSLSSKSLCKSSLFFTFIFQSMGRYTWERGRYQFAMGKKNTDFVSEL